MSRSASPQDIPLAEASINVDNSTSSSSSTSGGSGGGASSSTCSSDEDDGGDCSRDSFKSESQSSPAVDGPVLSPVPVNGIEVKPCRSIDSLSSSENDDVVRNDLLKKRQINNDVEGPSATDQETDFGGKLRFYLDGHCVLELRHDLDDNGQPKQWMQSWGKTYHPPLSSTQPPPPPPPWQPQELSSPESQEDRNPNLPDATTPSATKNKKKPYNGQFLMFFSRRRHDSSQPSKMVTLPRCILKRAARCPGHAVLSSNCICTHEKYPNGCNMLTRAASRSSSFQQKSQNIKYIAEDLAFKCVTNERGKELHLDDPASLDSLLLGALLTPKRNNSKPSRVIEGSRPHLDSNDSNKKGYVIEEKEKNETNVPVASWSNVDKNNFVSHAASSLGCQSSTIHSLQHATMDKKRVMETSNDNDLLDNSCATVLKKVKQECDIVSKDVSVQLPSSHPYNICSSGSLPVASGNLTIGCSKKERDVKPVFVIGDVLPIRETVTHLTCPSEGPINIETGQSRKKKGGYGRGRTIAESVRAFVISDILNLGGDVRTKYVPRGVFTEVASRYKIDATTTYRWWLKYCNGVRMVSNCTSRNTDSSQTSFLPCGTTAGPSYPSVPAGETEAQMISKYDKLGKQRFHVATTQPSVKIEHFSSMPQARENVQAKSYHHHHPHHRPSHGDNHSPRSDDSASSGASLVDPASLYASSIAFIPPNGTWQPNLQSVTNGRLSVLSPRMPLPVGLTLPYLFNYPSIPQYVSAHSEDLVSINGNKKLDSHNSDEPLDLTLPKQRTRIGESNLNRFVSSNTRTQIPNLGRSDRYTYSECPSSKLILKTLLSAHDTQVENDTDSSIKSAKKRKALKVKTKGMEVQLPVAQHSMKPKHYPFVSLQIGSFEIHSNLSPNSNYENGIVKESVNKFKVIFKQKKFVYEFEMSAEMECTANDGKQDEGPCSRRMACIVVPFSIVEAFWCYGTTINLQVISKPCMFLGQRLKQAGCVPSMTVYETKKTVDLTGGQLSLANLHKITLLKPHLVEQLKIYLVLFDIRYHNLMTPSILPVSSHTGEPTNRHSSESGDDCRSSLLSSLPSS